jgi:hypothetical protein
MLIVVIQCNEFMLIGDLVAPYIKKIGSIQSNPILFSPFGAIKLNAISANNKMGFHAL